MKKYLSFIMIVALVLSLVSINAYAKPTAPVLKVSVVEYTDEETTESWGENYALDTYGSADYKCYNVVFEIAELNELSYTQTGSGKNKTYAGYKLLNMNISSIGDAKLGYINASDFCSEPNDSAVFTTGTNWDKNYTQEYAGFNINANFGSAHATTFPTAVGTTLNITGDTTLLAADVDIFAKPGTELKLDLADVILAEYAESKVGSGENYVLTVSPEKIVLGGAEEFEIKGIADALDIEKGNDTIRPSTGATEVEITEQPEVVIAIFSKDIADGVKLEAGDYGIYFGKDANGKPMKYPGLGEVADGGLWAVKLVGPKGKLAAGDYTYGVYAKGQPDVFSATAWKITE